MNKQIVPHMTGMHNANYTQANWHVRALYTYTIQN